jgi:hypothetical protein
MMQPASAGLVAGKLHGWSIIGPDRQDLGGLININRIRDPV